MRCILPRAMLCNLPSNIKPGDIAWQGVKGSPYVANRGAIRLYQKSGGSCSVKLTISYEVPDILAPFAGALTPLVEGILATDMRRFADLASKGEPQAVTSR